MKQISAISGLFLVIFGGLTGLGADPISGASPAQLRRWLQEYPAADADRDGQLTIDEARAYWQRLQQQLSGRNVAGFQHEYTFATTSDGVKIALAVGYPAGFEREAGKKWPTIFSTSGYPNATVPTPPAQYGDRYVTVQASLRGTGASGGELCPWHERSWRDGYEIIEEWIVRQPWSNGRVGIQGYSWPGLMGFLTATTAPPSLKAVCVGGLIDDFYRGIARPGGVPNFGFPADWQNNFYRQDGVFGSDAAARLARALDESAFQEIVAARPGRNLAEDMLWLGLHEPLDGPQWQTRSLYSHAAGIRAPILIAHAWQDEQTGPTGWQLWNRLPAEVPKRLVLTNGRHGLGPRGPEETNAWFAHWLLDEPQPDLSDPRQRVQCYFETTESGAAGPPLVAGDFPPPDTRWTRLHLRSGNRLSRSPAAAAEETAAYQVQHNGPEGSGSHLAYLLEFPQATAICGPLVLTLWAQLTTLDTDFFVLLADRAPDGQLYGLQRGLLRASHRAIDEAASEYVEMAGERLLIRPRYLHRALQPIQPHEPHRFEIEIHAVGHVFRPGHQLALILTQPPAGDPIGITRAGTPSYRYDSHPPPGTVTVLHGGSFGSSLLVPILPELPPCGEPVPPQDQAGLQPAG